MAQRSSGCLLKVRYEVVWSDGCGPKVIGVASEAVSALKVR